jgi:hypothetical protein
LVHGTSFVPSILFPISFLLCEQNLINQHGIM